MTKNLEITKLAEEIMMDITDSRLPLHNILLKASRMALLLDMPDNVNIFKAWAKQAETNQFTIDSFAASMAAANTGTYAGVERGVLRDNGQKAQASLGNMRTETYNFAAGILTKWQFGNISESIFEKKRRKAEPVLQKIFPDINERLNSIEQNIASENSEDWKNAVSSCRTLLTDIADLLNPPQGADDKGKYINRLKDYVSPLVPSETKRKLLKSYFDELKKRIEYTMDITQGGSHQDRLIKEEAEDVVLYTYMLIADLMAIYEEKN